MIKLTNCTRRGERVPVYVNPRYIVRVSAAMNGSGDTVVEVEGSQYATWCAESVEEVMRLIDEDRALSRGEARVDFDAIQRAAAEVKAAREEGA